MGRAEHAEGPRDPKGPRDQGRPESLQIGGETVRSGRRKTFEVPVGRLSIGTELSLPVCVLNGRRPGPRVWLSAAIHGDELNGVEIISEVLARLDPRELAGVVVAVPVVNVFGFISQSRYLPDRRDLNRSFPGSPRGSLAARLAHLFLREVVSPCQVGIDLHTGSSHRTNLPQIRADLSDPETLRLAAFFGAPVLLHSSVRDGSLREAATRIGVRVLLYEGGEALHFNRDAIRAGVRGVLGVLSGLGMIEPDPGAPSPPAPFRAGTSTWARANRGGILHVEVDLGERVEAGQVVARITDTFGRRALDLRSPVSGIVIGLTTNPLVHRGEAVVHVAVAE